MTLTFWLWPAIILLSSLGASLVIFQDPSSPLRIPIILWFVGVCVGMAYIRLLRLSEAFTEWVLAVALSLGIAAVVSAGLLYTGRWSPERGFLILVVISLAGVALQIALAYEKRSRIFPRSPTGKLFDLPGKVAGRISARVHSASGFLDVIVLMLLLFYFSFVALVSSLTLIGLLVYYSFVVVTRLQ
jgi:hypothetical protein